MIELFYPIKPGNISQKFGNPNPIYTSQGLKGHAGIDFFANHGQAIYASHDGTCFPQVDNHGGNGVVLKTPDMAWQTLYWHMILDNAVVHTGQVVKAGDLLGYADSTGVSTGDHLHFQLTPLVNTDFGNGYNGAIDPTPYFNGKFAQDISVVEPPFRFTKVLRLGAWSNDVKQLQIALQKLNLYSGAIDGIFGTITESAVKQFQLQHDLVTDGIVGPKTNAVLNTL